MYIVIIATVLAFAGGFGTIAAMDQASASAASSGFVPLEDCIRAECQRLKALNFFLWSNHVTNATIFALAECPLLGFLDLSLCDRVTDISALKNCKNLKYLYLVECTRIPPGMIDELRKELPDCTIVDSLIRRTGGLKKFLT